MRGRTASGDVVPINLEIEATCRCNNAARRRREQDTEGSSYTSPPLSPNHTQMDGEPAWRVTLEDFSNKREYHKLLDSSRNCPTPQLPFCFILNFYHLIFSSLLRTLTPYTLFSAFFKGYFLSCMYICNKALVYWGFFFFSFPILALSYNFNIYIGKDVLDWI